MNKKLLPLALLDLSESGSIEGITRFQKLVFLAQKEVLGTEEYPFEPGSYGPFSKELYDDIDQLEQRGFLRLTTRPSARPGGRDEQIYTLADKGRRAIRNAMRNDPALADLENDEMEQLVRKYNQANLWDLLDHVYAEYPKMAKNSKLDI